VAVERLFLAFGSRPDSISMIRATTTSIETVVALTRSRCIRERSEESAPPSHSKLNPASNTPKTTKGRSFQSLRTAAGTHRRSGFGTPTCARDEDKAAVTAVEE